MALVLRLLLVLCLAATSVPGPMAHASVVLVAATQADADSDLPPCHAPDPVPTAATDDHGGARDCCADGGCGCGCANAAGLPLLALSAMADPAPQGPQSRTIPVAATPRLSPPVRPPIA